jgi:hypothetical protein
MSGVLADLIATLAGTAPRAGGLFSVAHDLIAVRDRQGDIDYPSAYQGANEVQQITQNSATGGNYKLTINTFDGGSFTTANIAFNANTAAIQSAIDTAMASYPGWTNGDIVVGGSALNAGTATFTYSGNSVKKKNHGLIAIDGTGLTGGSAGTPSTTTAGQTDRTAWAALLALGAITGSPPTQGSSTTFTADANFVTKSPKVSQQTIRAIANLAAIQDRLDTVEAAILSGLGIHTI